MDLVTVTECKIIDILESSERNLEISHELRDSSAQMTARCKEKAIW
jgi:hypothetical protein